MDMKIGRTRLATCVAEGFSERDGCVAQDIERLVDDEDGVVDHHADEDDEAEHGEDVERLIGQGAVDDLQPENAAASAGGTLSMMTNG